MPSDLVPVVLIVVVLLACTAGAVAAVDGVLRTVRLRTTSATGPLRVGSASGEHGRVAAFERAEGTTAWTRISGGL